MTDVTAEVVAIITGKLRNVRPQIQLTDKLEDLGLESLDAVEMIFELEERFDITIPYNAKGGYDFLQGVYDVAITSPTAKANYFSETVSVRAAAFSLATSAASPAGSTNLLFAYDK